MLIRGQTTEERIAQIADGFNKGAQNFIGGQDRQRQQAMQDRAYQNTVDTQRAQLQANKEARERALAQDVRATESHVAEMKIKEQTLGELLKPVEDTRDFKKQVAVAGVRNNSAENLYYAKQEAEAKKKMSQAVIPGFRIANPSIIPTIKDAEEIKKMNDSNKNLQDVGNSLMLKLSKINPADRTGLTNGWKLIEQDLTQMALQGKELANLGALSGPDFDLMNKDIGSISLGSINTIGTKGAISRVQAMLDRSKAKLRNKAQSRGYDPEEPAEDADSKDAKLKRLIELRARKVGG